MGVIRHRHEEAAKPRDKHGQPVSQSEALMQRIIARQRGERR